MRWAALGFNLHQYPIDDYVDQKDNLFRPYTTLHTFLVFSGSQESLAQMTNPFSRFCIIFTWDRSVDISGYSGFLHQ
jgi:hypothetical protein